MTPADRGFFMTKNGEKFSLKDIYNLIDSTRRELNASIKNLDDKFTALEVGRLSNLETKVADMQGRLLAGTGLIAFVVSVAIAVAGFLIK